MPEFLHPRAVVPKKTYIGANFCPDEFELRSVYENSPAQTCVSINAARSAVQQGAEAAEQLSTLQVRASRKAVIGQCLATIAAGRCLAYPRDTGLPN